MATDSAASYYQRSVIDYLSDAPHTARIYPVSGAIAIDAFVTVPLVEAALPTETSGALFIPNVGQYASDVQFVQFQNGQLIEYKAGEIVTTTELPPSDLNLDDGTSVAVSQDFLGSNTASTATGVNVQPTRWHYHMGTDVGTSFNNVPTYASIRFADYYSNIDLIVDETGMYLEADAGANLGQVAWQFSGDVTTTVQNNPATLSVETNVDPTVIVSQTLAADQDGQALPSQYIDTNGVYTLQVDHVDSQAPVVIGLSQTSPPDVSPPSDVEQPQITRFNEGSYGGDFGVLEYTSVEIGYDGSVYMVGRSTSSRTMTIVKLNSNGVAEYVSNIAHAYMTYSPQIIPDITVDVDGYVYAVGQTRSLFRTTGNAFQTTWNQMGYVRLDPTGVVDLASFFGGSTEATAVGIELDRDGYVYMAGHVRDNDNSQSFPTQFPGDQIVGFDIFLVKLDLDAPPANQLMYGRTFGGAGVAYSQNGEWAEDFHVDRFRNAYIVGHTQTPDFTMISTGSYNDTCTVYLPDDITRAACSASFVVKFGQDGTGGMALAAGTYLDWRSSRAKAVTTDIDGNVYVAGDVPLAEMPVVNGPYATHNGEQDAFIAQLSGDLGTLKYSTYYGGPGNETVRDIVVNDISEDDTIYIIGYTQSSTSFPLVNAIRDAYEGTTEGFYARFNPNDPTLTDAIQSTYIGGAGYDTPYRMDYIYNYGMRVVGSSSAPVPDLIENLNIVPRYVGGGGFEVGHVMLFKRLQEEPACTITFLDDAQLGESFVVPTFETVDLNRLDELHDLRRYVLRWYPALSTSGFPVEEAENLAPLPDRYTDLAGYDSTLIERAEGYFSSNTANFDSATHSLSDLHLVVDAYYLINGAMHRSRQTNIVRAVEIIFLNGSDPVRVSLADAPFWIYTGYGATVPPDEAGGCTGEDFNALDVLPDRVSVEAVLGDYGITLDHDSTDPSIALDWSDYEARSILLGVVRIADSFEVMNVRGTTPQDRFRTVYSNPITFLRISTQEQVSSPHTALYDELMIIQNGQEVPQRVCKAASTTFVVCRGEIANLSMNYDRNTRQGNPEVPNQISQYTVVHELGHVLDYISGNEIYDRVHLPGGFVIVPDCMSSSFPSTVMGELRGWQRGFRGWGSSATQEDESQGLGLSDFQQNAPPYNLIEEAILETAADMYLNWVYRITTDAPPIDINGPLPILSQSNQAQYNAVFDEGICTLSQPIEGGWEGFQNIAIEMNTDRTQILRIYDDENLPGNARYIFMHGTMFSVLQSYR